MEIDPGGITMTVEGALAMNQDLDLRRREDRDRWHHLGAQRVVAHSARLHELIRSLEPSDHAAPVPGLDWTVADVVAHLASVWRRYTVDRSRATTWAGVATANAQDITDMGRDVAALVADMEGNVALMAAAPDLVDPAALLEFHAGQHFTLAGAWGNALNELLVHGDDIARAVGASWAIDDADLEPFWRHTSAILPGFLTDHGRAATDLWELRLGFESGPVRLRFDHGALHVDEPVPGDERSPDHVVEGAAAAVTLAMPWRRRPSDDPSVQEFCRRVVAV